ncbi:hypothetical protein [Couchioplanes caeruleus]|uniref:Tissue inhibitor of metalloproteinase n=2 Tax=Couchioplanes caeruleus TaxID=56438 RepID=A0A1K0FG83_9ACTN|nr:hypothetical protein [Couchioplanes caeruleus]OJF11813.1 hypothetical protein BG844_24195 [Couchioplanes caeruleus subsp. caeruleus]ROP32434.1 hypothetical protein EDD30_5374 [Couchioplanes caeruleus]
MKLRAAILFALTFLGLGMVVLASPPGPAWACSCAVDYAEMEKRADVIVVGTVTEVTDTGIALSVESVEKGDTAGATALRLQVSPGGASCGYPFREGGRYRVNSSDGATGVCAGVSELAPRPPVAVSTHSTTAPPLAQSSPSRWWLVGAAAMTVLVGGVVVAAVRRRGSA